MRGERASEADGMIDIDITTRGEVSEEDSNGARQRLADLDRHVPDPVLGARLMLRCEPNPRLERPARAEVELDVNGRLVCGRVAAATMSQAISELAEQLERQLEEFSDRRARLQRRASQPAAGEWRHGTRQGPRPSYALRPAEERELIRRKTFAVEPVDPLQAVADMLDLDHDFYLFRDALAGADAVVYRRDDGRIGLIAHGSRSDEDELVHEVSRLSGPITLQAAISEMDALSHRFMFFLDAGTGRGNVIYVRYDGHYGLIEPAT